MADWIDLDLFVGLIIVTRDIIEKSCIPFALGSIGCRLTSFIQVGLETSLVTLEIRFFSRERYPTIQGTSEIFESS